MSFTRNNSLIVSLPNNPVTVRGYTADWVFWDEAAKFPHEGDMRASLLPTMTRHGRVSYISTHRGTSTQFYGESVKAKRDRDHFGEAGYNVEMPGYEYYEIPYYVVPDPAYIEGYEKFKKQFGEDSFFFREEFMCIAVDESVAMFTHEMIARAHDLWEKHECAYRMPDGKHKVFMGIDIGRTQDVTVAYAIEDFGEYAQVIWVEEWQGRPFPEQKALLVDLIERVNPTFVRVDHTGMGMNLAEDLMGIFGARVEGVDFTVPNKDMLMIATYIQMRNFRVAIPTEEFKYGSKLENQLRNVHRERSERSGQPKYVPLEGQMSDDHTWAFCLAASLLTNPNPGTVTFVLGDKGSSIMSDDTGKFKKEQFPAKYGQRNITYAVGAVGTSKEARELNVETQQKAKKWMGPWTAPKVLECEACKKAGRKIKRKDGTETTPTFVLQSKTHNSSQYSCEGCFADRIVVRKN
jgi:phage FluMu gp28-like protein